MKASSPVARLGSPQVLIALLALLAAITFAWRSGRDASLAPVIVIEDGAASPANATQVVIYIVQDELARPVVREITTPAAMAETMQATLDALRFELVERGIWPDALPSPRVFTTELQRRSTAILDLPGRRTPPLDVQAERTILASIERTLLEAGMDTVVYLRDGGPVPAWLGRLATASELP